MLLRDIKWNKKQYIRGNQFGAILVLSDLFNQLFFYSLFHIELKVSMAKNKTKKKPRKDGFLLLLLMEQFSICRSERLE